MFDWKLEEMPGMDYTIINVGGGTGGGMMKKPDPGIPDNWLPYIMVDDVAASPVFRNGSTTYLSLSAR
jgi:predicted enzyme related to lactoylglutathione lyase